MTANVFDAEIKKFLPMLDNEEKRSLLTIIKNFLQLEKHNKGGKNSGSSSIDYTKYHFPASAIKFNRDEINER